MGPNKEEEGKAQIRGPYREPVIFDGPVLMAQHHGRLIFKECQARDGRLVRLKSTAMHVCVNSESCVYTYVCTDVRRDGYKQLRKAHKDQIAKNSAFLRQLASTVLFRATRADFVATTLLQRDGL